MARVEEAKDTPVVSVIDSPQIAEKKSFPPRLLVILLLTAFTFGVSSACILIRHQLDRIGADDPRRLLAQQIGTSITAQLRRLVPPRRGVQ